MTENHIIPVSFKSGGRTITRSAYQYDYGQVLQFVGFEGLPETFEVHFSIGRGKSVTMIGTDAVVDVPDECLQAGEMVTAWLFLHDSDSDGETRYVIEIPVKYRAEITNQRPRPVQQDAITRAIAALNKATDDPLKRVTSLNGTVFANGSAIEACGIPVYVEDGADYAEYGNLEKGWYIFARIGAPDGVTVSESTSVTGANAIVVVGTAYIDAAIRFDVAAMAQVVTVAWDTDHSETFVFRASDLAVRNLDYRTTFYIYDIAPFATWSYAPTADATFVAGKNYYTKDGDNYTLAEVTAGEAVAADTYYNHSKLTFQGMARNVTYQFNEIVDCPQEYILPEIEDDGHGAWFEIRLRHAGSYSSTLVPPEGVKVATEHTQAETAGFNMVDLHYTAIDGVKLWRFMNTHSSVPA